MNHETLHKLIDEKQKNICQIAIMHHGELIYSDTWNGYRKDDSVHIASATKSITAILVGIAIDKGIIESVEQDVLDSYISMSELSYIPMLTFTRINFWM